MEKLILSSNVTRISVIIKDDSGEYGGHVDISGTTISNELVEDIADELLISAIDKYKGAKNNDSGN